MVAGKPLPAASMSEADEKQFRAMDPVHKVIPTQYDFVLFFVRNVPRRSGAHDEARFGQNTSDCRGSGSDEHQSRTSKGNIVL